MALSPPEANHRLSGNSCEVTTLQEVRSERNGTVEIDEAKSICRLFQFYPASLPPLAVPRIYRTLTAP